MRVKYSIAAMLALMLLTAGAAMAASVEAWSVSGGNESYVFQGQGVGGNDIMEFTVGPSPILVTDLGTYNTLSSTVGIFQASDLSLVGTTASATGPGFGSQAGYTPVSSFLLQANTDYYLAGYAQELTNQIEGGVQTTNPAITFAAYYYNYDGSLNVSDRVTYSTTYHGPDFKFTVVPTPVSASMGLTLMSVMGGLVLFRKRNLAGVV